MLGDRQWREPGTTPPRYAVRRSAPAPEPLRRRSFPRRGKPAVVGCSHSQDTMSSAVMLYRGRLHAGELVKRRPDSEW